MNQLFTVRDRLQLSRQQDSLLGCSTHLTTVTNPFFSSYWLPRTAGKTSAAFACIIPADLVARVNARVASVNCKHPFTAYCAHIPP